MSLHPPPKQKTILFLKTYFYSLLLPGYGGGGGEWCARTPLDGLISSYLASVLELQACNVTIYEASPIALLMCRYAILRLQYSELLALSLAINNCWTPRDGVAVNRVIVLCWLLVWL